MIGPGPAARFSRELGALLAMGHPLLEALGRVRLRANPALAGVLRQVEEDVRSGNGLAEALDRRGNTFPAPFRRAVHVGERTGALPAALGRAADLLEGTEWRRAGIQAALAYPRFLFSVGALGLLALAWILPGLFSVFRGYSVALPLPTRMVMALADLLDSPLVLGLFLLGIALVYALLAGAWGLDGLRLRLPVLGTWIRRQESVTCLEWLDYLLGARVPLDEALRIASGAATSPAFAAGLGRLADQIAAGSTLAAAPGARIFPAMGAWLVGEAERREFPPGLLGRVARTLQREADMASHRGLALLEPLALVLFGMTMAFVVLAYFLPLYQLIGTMG